MGAAALVRPSKALDAQASVQGSVLGRAGSAAFKRAGSARSAGPKSAISSGSLLARVSGYTRIRLEALKALTRRILPTLDMC